MYSQLATGCWLLLPLAAGYWLYAGLVAYNITFVYLLRAFSHVLETLINGKSAKRHVWNLIEKYSKYRKSTFFLVGCWLLAAGCYWRWLLANGYVQSAGYWLLAATAAGCWLLAICRSSCLQYHLCLPFACFFPWSCNAYKREKCQTSRLKPYRKYRKNRKSVGCWLLAAGCYCRWLLATGYMLV